MHEEAALVPLASALNNALEGEPKVKFGAIMGGLSLSSGENAPEDYENYTASLSLYAKGKFLAVEVGTKYSNNYYYEAAGMTLGLGFGIGNNNTGAIFLGGFDGYVLGFSTSEDYQDEDGDDGQFGVPYNLSGTFYHGVENGLGLVVKFTHYFGDALLGENETYDLFLPNPYPSSHISFGLAF